MHINFSMKKRKKCQLNFDTFLLIYCYKAIKQTTPKVSGCNQSPLDAVSQFCLDSSWFLPWVSHVVQVGSGVYWSWSCQTHDGWIFKMAPSHAWKLMRAVGMELSWTIAGGLHMTSACDLNFVNAWCLFPGACQE